MPEKIKIGVSTCLLGHKVRYDGGHKHDRFITDTLGLYLDFVPVCPEVECGLSVPREALRLVGSPENPRLVTQKTGRDLTDQMTAWGRSKLDELAALNLGGFIFKSKSPSSGMERVKVYTPQGMPSHTGVGVWARMFMNRFPPCLPVEDEGRLHDPLLRSMFIEKIFIFQRWREAMAGNPTWNALQEFHTPGIRC
jgi:uncharacterized protein YbbK (DUF523 family)